MTFNLNSVPPSSSSASECSRSISSLQVGAEVFPRIQICRFQSLQTHRTPHPTRIKQYTYLLNYRFLNMNYDGTGNEFLNVHAQIPASCCLARGRPDIGCWIPPCPCWARGNPALQSAFCCSNETLKSWEACRCHCSPQWQHWDSP